MDASVERLRTPEECEIYAGNVAEKYPHLAVEARRRGITLRAQKHGAKTVVEQEALEVIYAYEEALFRKHGRRQPAAYTWRKVKKDGIIAAVEYAVRQKKATTGYTTLKEMNLEQLTYESVVVRHPDVFSPEAVARSRQRLREWEQEQPSLSGRQITAPAPS